MSGVLEVILHTVLKPGTPFTVNCLHIDRLFGDWPKSHSLKDTHTETQRTLKQYVSDLGNCLTAKGPWENTKAGT